MSVTLKSRDVSALARPGGVNRRSGLGQAGASRCGVIRMRKAGNHLISIGRGWKLNPPNRRGTDPYARWCGRGGIARCPPIPTEEGCRTAILDHQERWLVSRVITPTEFRINRVSRV